MDRKEETSRPRQELTGLTSVSRGVAAKAARVPENGADITTTNSGLAVYDAQAVRWAQEYENINSQELNAWLLPFIPTDKKTAVLDIGAGSGRDATWFAAMDYPTVAVEPSAGMRAEGAKMHPMVGFEWVADSLPQLRKVTSRCTKYGFINLSAVWMHVAPADRILALTTVASLLTQTGVLAITVRVPPVPDRGMYPTPTNEIPELAGRLGGEVVYHDKVADVWGRPEADLAWLRYALRWGPERPVATLDLQAGTDLPQ